MTKTPTYFAQNDLNTWLSDEDFIVTPAEAHIAEIIYKTLQMYLECIEHRLSITPNRDDIISVLSGHTYVSSPALRRALVSMHRTIEDSLSDSCLGSFISSDDYQKRLEKMKASQQEMQDLCAEHRNNK